MMLIKKILLSFVCKAQILVNRFKKNVRVKVIFPIVLNSPLFKALKQSHGKKNKAKLRIVK